MNTLHKPLQRGLLYNPRIYTQIRCFRSPTPCILTVKPSVSTIGSSFHIGYEQFSTSVYTVYMQMLTAGSNILGVTLGVL